MTNLKNIEDKINYSLLLETVYKDCTIFCKYKDGLTHELKIAARNDNEGIETAKKEILAAYGSEILKGYTFTHK